MTTQRANVKTSVARSLGALLIGAVLLPGCSTDLNARLTIGAERHLPVFQGMERDGSRTAPDDSQATRLDRADWDAIEFRVPPDGTVHSPLWATMPSFSDDHPRAHGLYPTPSSSLDLEADTSEGVMMGFTEAGRALADLVLLPLRAVLHPAWSHEQSPSMYKRWRSGEWLAGPVPGEDGAQ